MSEKQEETQVEETEITNLNEMPPFNPLSILGYYHQIFLYSAIDEETTRRTCQELVAMDLNNIYTHGDDVNSYQHICLRIYSPGGYVSGGWAIIDTMRTIKTPVFTIVSGQAASMASFITIAGDQRIALANAKIMLHPISGGGFDYLDFIKDGVKEMERSNDAMVKFLKEKTKLGMRKNKKHLEKALHGELYLNAQEALKLGVVDQVI